MTENKLGKMLQLLERDKLLTVIYNDIDKHDSLGAKKHCLKLKMKKCVRLLRLNSARTRILTK